MGEVSLWFPQVLGGGVTFPFDEELVPSPGTLVCDDCFYLILGFFFYKVQWWFQEVCSMDIIFFVGGEKGGVKDRVYPLLHQVVVSRREMIFSVMVKGPSLLGVSFWVGWPISSSWHQAIPFVLLQRG